MIVWRKYNKLCNTKCGPLYVEMNSTQNNRYRFLYEPAAAVSWNNELYLFYRVLVVVIYRQIENVTFTTVVFKGLQKIMYI